MSHLLLAACAILSLIPAGLRAHWGEGTRNSVFWALALVAVAGPASYLAAGLSGPAGVWHAGPAGSLWVTVTWAAILYLFLSLVSAGAHRLAALVYPYLAVLALLALLTEFLPSSAPEARPMGAVLGDPWLLFHVVVSVVTYGLLTLAAVSALAVIIQERSLKSRKKSKISDILPAARTAETLQIGLLAAAGVVLLLGLATGMAVEFRSSGQLLVLDHKTLLVLLSFLAIAILLAIHWQSGMRGRQAARWILVAYLLLSLAFPGVKFISYVLLGR